MKFYKTVKILYLKHRIVNKSRNQTTLNSFSIFYKLILRIIDVQIPKLSFYLHERKIFIDKHPETPY